MKDPRFTPLSSDSGKHLDRVVRDLALGFLNNKWRNRFRLQGGEIFGELKFVPEQNPDLKEYFADEWNNQPPDVLQLVEFGYLSEVNDGLTGDDTATYKLTTKALDLARTPAIGSIFISYQRLESSPFALWLSDRLKSIGLAPFLDNQLDEEDQGISLKPAGKWKFDLKDAIEARKDFIVLVAPTTLSSKPVCQEILWALASNKRVIPIWHRGFNPKNREHVPDELPAPIREVISDINAIVVVAEDPYQYEVAIGKLLSLFEITS